MRIVVYDVDGNQIDTQTIASLAGTSEYSALGEIDYIPPAGARIARFGLYVLSANASFIGFNSASCIRKAAGSTLLLPGSVTSDLVTASTVRALLGQFASLEAANLRVGHAEIDTLQLRGNAVTIPVSADGNSTIRLSASSGERNLMSVSLNRQGAPTFILVTVQIAGYVDQAIASFRLYRNGNRLTAWPGVSGIDGVQSSVSFAYLDETLGTGSTTYQLRAERAVEGPYDGDPQITQRAMLALHTMR